MVAQAMETELTESGGWVAADFDAANRPYHLLTEPMVAEIRAAAETALASGRPHYQWRRDDFALDQSAPLLSRAYDDVENGPGFVTVGGWPVDDCSYDLNVAAYAVIASHLGDIKIQNYEGDWVVDVRNDDKPYSHTSRGYQSDALLPFHTDGADVTGLLGLGEAARGGETILVSALTVYNVIAKERPDLMELLHRGFYHHRRRQHPEGEHPISAERIPVFAIREGLLHCCYNRNPIDWVRHEGMTLSDDEVETLDVFDAVLSRPELQVPTTIRKGEMLFFNNFTSLHSRTAFEDDAAHRRHLVRLWMEDASSKRLGQTLLDLYVPGTSRYKDEARAAG